MLKKFSGIVIAALLGVGIVAGGASVASASTTACKSTTDPCYVMQDVAPKGMQD